MLHFEALQKIIPAVYEAGLGKSPWPDVLERLSDLFGSSIAALGVRTQETQFVVANRTAITSDIESVCLSPAMHSQGSSLVGCPTTTSTLLSPRSSGTTRDCSVLPDERMEIVQALLFCERASSGVFAMARPSRRGPFGNVHLESVRDLCQHLRQAIRIQMHLTDADIRYQYLSEALDQIRHGVIVVDSDAWILHANREAKTIIAAGDAIQVDRGRQGGSKLRQPHTLIRLLADSLTVDTRHTPIRQSTLIRRITERQPILATIVPLKDDRSVGIPVNRPKAMIHLVDPERADTRSQQLLQSAHGLTQTEAAVADLIANGLAPKQIARTLSIAPSTVRTPPSCLCQDRPQSPDRACSPHSEVTSSRLAFASCSCSEHRTRQTDTQAPARICLAKKTRKIERGFEDFRAAPVDRAQGLPSMKLDTGLPKCGVR